MKTTLKRILLLIGIGAALCLWQSSAEAARTFAVTNVSVAEFDMDGTVDHPITVRFQSTNTVTNNNTDQIYQIVFQVSATYTTFSATQPVQANGWTCARNSTTQVTCATGQTAGPNRILNVSPNFQNFTLNIRSVATAYDRIVGFSRVTATYYRTNGRTSTSANTATAARWTWKTLGITLTALPASPGSGCTTTLTMHITKYSTTTPLTITPVLQAPSGSATATLKPGYPSPATLTLSTAAPSGDIIWVYTITGTTGQSVTFTGCARSGGANCTTTSGSTRTSRTVSSMVTVAANSCGLNVLLTNSQVCLYSGDTTTFTMTVTNTTGVTAINVQPSVLTPAPVTVPTIVFGPFNPAVQAPISLPTGSSRTFTWTATVSGNPNDTYAVRGNATANGGLTAPPMDSPSQDVDGYIAPPPDVTNTSSITADSTNLELDWNITNFACSKINSVNIGIPGGGWTFADDGDALVTNVALVPDDSWLRSAGSTTFTAQAPADRIPSGGYDGDFYLLFSQTPVTSGTYTFTVTIVDDAVPPVTRVKQTVVIVNPFDNTGPNETDTSIWHEDIR